MLVAMAERRTPAGSPTIFPCEARHALALGLVTEVADILAHLPPDHAPVVFEEFQPPKLA